MFASSLICYLSIYKIWWARQHRNSLPLALCCGWLVCECALWPVGHRRAGISTNILRIYLNTESAHGSLYKYALQRMMLLLWLLVVASLVALVAYCALSVQSKSASRVCLFSVCLCVCMWCWYYIPYIYADHICTRINTCTPLPPLLRCHEIVRS